MKKITTRKIAVDGMLSALCFVLATFCSFNLSNSMRFTLDAFPIILAALLYGPVDGMIVGGVGTFFYQIYTYGLSSTTLMWIAPALIRGGLLGLYAMLRKYDMKRWEILVAVIISSLIVTAVNTLVIYLDGIIWGYQTAVLVMLPYRILTSLIVAVIYGLLVPDVVYRLKPLLLSVQKD